MERKAYTVQEVADMIAVSKWTVRDMLKMGQLKGIKAGREWRITAKALNEFLYPADEKKEDDQQ